MILAYLCIPTPPAHICTLCTPKMSLLEGGSYCFLQSIHRYGLVPWCFSSPLPCSLKLSLVNSPRPGRSVLTTTMGTKDENDEEQQAFLSSHQSGGAVPFAAVRSRTSTWHLRLILECVMAVAILVLLVRPIPASCRWESERFPVPKCAPTPEILAPFPRQKEVLTSNLRMLCSPPEDIHIRRE